MKFAGYADTEESRFLQGQKKWAASQLDKENVLFPSGKWSHDCAYEVLDEVEDKLIDHMRFYA